MSEMPSISVVIPAYNREHMIARAIESVLAQTHPPAEVVVVDDGSTDNTAEVVGRYEDRGVRCIRKDNGGASSARNLGIALSTGDWIAFLDSDDLWQPGMLQAQGELLSKHSGAGLSFCDAAWYVDDELAEEKTNWSARRASFAQTLDVSPGCTGCFAGERFYQAQTVIGLICSPTQVLAKRELFDTSGAFRSEYDPVEDYEMWLRASERFDICYVDEPLAAIRSHTGSLTRRPELAEKFRRNTRRVIEAALARADRPALRAACQQRLRRIWDTEIAADLETGNYAAARETIRTARRHGWQVDRGTGRPIRLAARFGPEVGGLYRRLTGLFNRPSPAVHGVSA